MSISDIIKRINDNVKGVHASMMTDSDIATSTDFVKTPALDLNRILSGSLFKGIANRNLVGIVGPEHTFKSSFMVLCMVEGLRQGYEALIIDTERGVTNEFCQRWGMDLSKIGYVYQPWVDKIMTILAQVKESGQQKMIIGIDSMGGVDQYKMFEDALDDDPKGDQGQLQRWIRRLLKLLLNICVEQNSIGIVTGHMYSQPSKGFPLPDQIGGGKAMKMFPSVLISLKKESIKDGVGKDAKITGNQITATTLKNRIYPPFQQAIVKIDYSNGIEPYAGLLDIMVNAGMVEKAGAWFSYKGERLGQGEKNTEENLHKFPQLLEELDVWLKTTGYSTVNKNVEEAEQLLESEIVTEPNDEKDKPSKRKKKEQKEE